MKSENRPQKKNNYFDPEEANLDYADYEEVDDKQYKAMLPDKKGKLDSLSYFKKSEKYAGKVSKKEDAADEVIEDENESSEELNENDGIKTALKEIKSKRKERSRLLEEDLKAIDEEDKIEMNRMRDVSKQEGDPEALQNQLFEYNKLIEMRYHAQKNLEDLKKYPANNFPVSQTLHTLQKESEKSVISNLSQMVENYEKLAIEFFSKSGNFDLKITNYEEILESKDVDLKNKRLNVENLWEKFEEETRDLNDRMEEEIINWSQRTTLLRNSTSKSQYNSLMMQTPIGQAKKAIEDWDKVSKKCQQKRGPIKILFEGEENLRENTNVNIYDDIDLLQEVQRNYEQELDKDDKDFLIKDTLKYLENKNRTKVTKDVDRKASKNRKIRFNVHTKLLNFLPSESENLLEARDEIVKNLFNKGTHHEEAVDYIDV